jgi:omega-6 fatty acid desaturase (delta-12 desaturase)
MKEHHFQANNWKAFTFLITPILFLSLGLFFSYTKGVAFYFLSILFLSLFSTQSFILLHECAHMHFFQSRIQNRIFGNVFGICSGIPFTTWKYMHHLHHKWTGWRDKDPTTEVTVDPSSSKAVLLVANFSWIIFFPIFYLAYHVSNYWNLKKIERFVKPHLFKQCIRSVFFYALLYSFLFLFLPIEMVVYVLPSFFLSCIWRELIILTQHTHIDIPISEGKEVNPIGYYEQIPYTRSFYIGEFFEKYFLFNFNLHEAHHAYPGLPAYHLHKVNLNLDRTPSYWHWFKEAKGMWGVDFIFRTSKHTNKKF